MDHAMPCLCIDHVTKYDAATRTQIAASYVDIDCSFLADHGHQLYRYWFKDDGADTSTFKRRGAHKVPSIKLLKSSTHVEHSSTKAPVNDDHRTAALEFCERANCICQEYICWDHHSDLLYLWKLDVQRQENQWSRSLVRIIRLNPNFRNEGRIAILAS